MSCLCYICKASDQIETHIDYLSSAFTEKSSLGNLYIEDYTLSIPDSFLGFRLNRFMSIHPKDSVLIFPTWTIEDCLFIEVYNERFELLGLGKLYLAKCAFSNPEPVQDIEWFTDITAEITVTLEYKPFIFTEINCAAVFRQSIIGDDHEKLDLIVKINEKVPNPHEIITEHKLRDLSLGYKEEFWQQLAICRTTAEIECVLKSEKNKRSSLILPITNKTPVRCVIPTPSFSGSSVLIYVMPFYSAFIENPSNTIFFQMQKINNIWLSSLPENSVLSISLKSELFSEGVVNETMIKITEIEDILEYQFVSYSIEDKLLIKCLEGTKLVNVGILKLKEVIGITLNSATESNVQLGYNSCQFWLTFANRQRDTLELKATGREKEVEKALSKLTYKDPIFLDVLELMEYKTNRIKQQKTLITTQINKISSRNEILKKRISELERAPSLADYQKASANNATKPKPEVIKKEVYEGICSCGRPNPKFKGYCEVCVKSIRETYEKLLKWFSPIESKHRELENRFININGRRILLETKVKRLEEKIMMPIEIGMDSGIEEAAELAGNLRKIEEEIKIINEESEKTAELYTRQQASLQTELEKREIEQNLKKNELEKYNAGINTLEKVNAEAGERMVFKQYFNDKYGNKSK